MLNVEEIGNVEKRHDEVEFEWQINDFFSVAENKREMISPSFYFMDSTLHFVLYLESDSGSEFVNLHLVQTGNLECSVEYYFGLKKLDSTIEYLIKGNLTVKSDTIVLSNGIRRRFTKLSYFKLSDVQRRKSELAPSDVLYVTCTLKCETAHREQANLLKPPKLQKLTILETLSEDFKNLFLNKDSCDTTLLVKDREFKAHRAVLMARSSVFSAMFLHETLEKQTGIVNITDCDSESFEEFLEFLYSGKLETPSWSNALSLYETSEKYNVQELKTLCSEILIENLTVEHFCDTVVLADRYNDKNLLCAAQCFFTKNLRDVLVTSQWQCLLKNNFSLGNKLLIEMSSKVKTVD